MTDDGPRDDLSLLEEEVAAFARRLDRDGVPEEVLQRETGKIRLFLFHYLLGHARTPLAEVTSRDVVDFAGTWYMRHVANATTESIRSMLRTLRTFFTGRKDRGPPSGEALASIFQVLHNEAFYVTRLEEYDESVGDEEAFDTWLDKRWGWVDLDAGTRSGLFQPRAAAPDIVGALGEGPLPPLSDDFLALLGGIRTADARLGRTRRRLAAATVRALNGLMEDPETLPDRARQTDAPRVSALFAAAVRLRLCGLESGGRVTALSTIDSVEAMGKRERFALLLDTLWNLVPWETLAPGSGPPQPGALQEERGHLARWLSRHPPGEEIPIRSTPVAARMEEDGGMMHCILPVFSRAGIWECRLRSRPGRGRRRIDSLRLTPLGQRVLAEWAKAAGPSDDWEVS